MWVVGTSLLFTQVIPLPWYSRVISFSPSKDRIQWLVSREKNEAEVVKCHFQDYVTKRWQLHSWTHFLSLKEASFHFVSWTPRGPCGKELRETSCQLLVRDGTLPAASWVNAEANPPPVKPWETCSPRPHRDCSGLRDISCAQIPDSQKLWHNKCVF